MWEPKKDASGGQETRYCHKIGQHELQQNPQAKTSAVA